MNKQWVCIVLFCLLTALCTNAAFAQVTIAVLGNPLMNVNSVAAIQNGVTISHTTVRITAPRRTRWELRLRAAGDLTLNTQTIPIGQVNVRVTNLDITTQPEKPLSTVLQLIASEQVIKQNDRIDNININYRLNGGNHLLKPGGNYTTVLTFSITQL